MTHTATDPRFHAILDPNAPVNRLATGFIFTEGPLWHPVEKHLTFSDMPGDVRRRLWPDGRVEELARPSNKANGLTYDRNMNMLLCEHSTSSVVRISPSGQREVLTSHFEGKELNSPNDIVVRSDGAIFFTDPTFGRMEHFGVPRPLQQGHRGVYMLPADHRPGDEAVLVSDRYMFSQPNGLCLSPCERWIWVNDTEQCNIRMFDVAQDGHLSNARIFASGIKDALREGVPDGMKADTEGNVYVTAPGGVWVYDFHGVKLGEISIPEKSANLHWGDDDWQTLYVCASTSVYSVRTKATGRVEPFMSGERQATEAVASGSLNIVPRRTALILQDLQNDVMIDGGAFASTGSPDHAAAGIMVIHVWMICEPGHPHLSQHAPLFQGLKGENALVRGTWGVAPAPGLEPASGDLVVEKMSMSAWETSRLESYLHHGGRDTIINCGAWTNMSVEHTARTAADKGFRVIVPEDACSTMNADWHRASIDYAMHNVASVTTTHEVLTALST